VNLPGLRDECLNETLFTILAQARTVLAEWRKDYNTVRPHSSLRYRPTAPQVIVQRAVPPLVQTRSLN